MASSFQAVSELFQLLSNEQPLTDYISELDVDGALEPLLSYSLAKFTSSRDKLRIHPVVHAWARERLNNDDKRRKTFLALQYLIAAVRLQYDGTKEFLTFTSRFRADIGACFINMDRYIFAGAVVGMPSHAWEDASELAWCFFDQGLYSKAERLWHAVLGARRSALGDANIATVNSFRDLGRVWNASGYLSKAGESYKSALAALRDLSQPDESLTFLIRRRLASVYSKLGNLGTSLNRAKCINRPRKIKSNFLDPITRTVCLPSMSSAAHI
jgi:tetratricopeptide (TPR) repeat protein